jgi:hypothetical protein
MTRMQRRAEDQLTKEVEKRNEQLTAEDREKNLRWMVVGRRGEKRMIKGTEREQQNYGRREVQLGDFMPREQQQQQQQRDYRSGIETGARRKEYYQQQTHTLSGPTLLAPRQQNSTNYIPVQHTRQPSSWQQQQQNYQQQYQQQNYQQQQQYSHHNTPGQGNSFNNISNISGPGPVPAHYNNNNGIRMAQPNNINSNGNGGSNNNGGNFVNGGGYASGGNSNNSGSINGGGGFGNGGGHMSNSVNNSYGPANIQLTWRGGQSNNDSGYTEPNWQDRRHDGNGEWQGNTHQRTPDRLNTTAADPPGNNDGVRPRLNSKRGRDGPDSQAEDGPPRTRHRL